MIYTIFFIDVDSGLSLIEWINESEFESFEPLFQAINDIVDDVRKSLNEKDQFANITRMLMVETKNILIHYFNEGNFLVSCTVDGDDDKEKLISILQILARRFWMKHQPDIEMFRLTNQKEILNSFLVDIENFTLKGRVAEIKLTLLVSESTLNRLLTMNMITEKEYQFALLCKTPNMSPQLISDTIQIGLEECDEYLKKLKTLDIVSY